MLRSLKFCFCTASTFRNKSKLTEFYKAIHPDMLHNAPDNVKVENTRSLKILNGYFDSVAQNQKTEPQEIIFYVPNKSNTKARKFYPITVTLDAYLQKNMDDALNRVVVQLNDKISQKQDEISKMHLKPSTFQTSQNYQKIKEDLLSETTSLKKKSAEKEQEYQALQTQLFLEQDRQKAREQTQKLMRQIRGSPSPNIKPAVWRELIMEKSDLVPNISDIFQELIDPRSVYLDEKLTNQQVDLFISKLAPKFDKQRETEKLKGLFKVMETMNIFLLVSDHYSGSDIVGYFSIKYNFNVDELLEQFFLFKDSIVKGFQIYENELARYKDSISTLLQKYRIQKLDNQIPLKNTDILRQLNISLLVLIRNLNNVEKQRLLSMSEKQWIITDNLDEIKETQTNIYLPLKYNSSFI